jgi:hypothetical protein
MMELYLQFGYGMMEHCRQLVQAWKGGTVVLSPRDLNDAQLERLSREVVAVPDGRVLVDPQFYLPNADHDRLVAHDYWPNDYASDAFFDGTGLTELIRRLLELNRRLSTSAVILPGMLCQQVDDAWLTRHGAFLNKALELQSTKPLWSTLALSADVLRSRDQVNTLLEAASRWDAAAFYVVCEHPSGDYLVSDPLWLAHVLDLVAGLGLAGRKVVMGYCNHQMLSVAAAGASAICSGTWMNVRSFPPDKFRSAYEDEIKRKATWFYCPEALSEFKLPYLDLAFEAGVLNDMRTPAAMDGGYAARIFSGVQPSSAGFTEQMAFRHYLHALRAQARLVGSASSYDEAREVQSQVLERAEQILGTLRAAGVTGQNRDFAECLDVNRSALTRLDALRGPVLRRRWGELRPGA